MRYSNVFKTVLILITIFSASIFAQKQEVVKSVEDPDFKGSVESAEAYKAGLDFFDKEDYKSAIIQFDKSLELVPNNPKVLFAKGLAYKNNKMTSYAIQSLEECVKADSLYEKAYSQLGSIFLVERQFEKSYSNYEKASNLDSTDYSNFYGMAKARFYGGKYLEAAKLFEDIISMEKVQKRTSTKRKMYEFLLRAYLDAGDNSSVVNAYERDADNKRSKNGTAYYGEALYNSGNKQKALAVFEALAKKGHIAANQWVEKIKKEL